MKPITNIDDPRYVKAMSHPLRSGSSRCSTSARPARGARRLARRDAGDGRVPRADARAPRPDRAVPRPASAAPSSTTTARKERPSVSDEAWAAAPADREAGRRLGLAGDDRRLRHARPARPAASTTATPTSPAPDAPRRPRLRGRLPAPACGSSPSSTRSRRPRQERIGSIPHSGETKDVALVMMLFEAARGGAHRSPRRFRVARGASVGSTAH